MTGLLLDTHSVIWFALDDERLSENARLAITSEIADRRSPSSVRRTVLAGGAIFG